MIGSMLCLLHEYAMQQRKASLDTLVSRKTDESLKATICKFCGTVLLLSARSRSSERACDLRRASTYMKPGVVTAIRGSRKDVVEAIVGVILV